MPLLYHKTVYHVLALPVYYVTTLYTSVVRRGEIARTTFADSRGRLSLRLKSKNIIAYQGNTQHLRL